MITTAAVMQFTPAQLFEHLGVRLYPIGTDLEVRFANGQTEHFIPAPDGYPLDGSLALIKFEGRYYIPLDEGDR